MNELACVVVLYNPDKTIIDKMGTYCDYFKKVILVDNSDEDKSNLFTNDKIVYIPLMKNMGIAHALNIGVRKAKDLGFKWVMTLDQDSMISKDCITQLLGTIKSVECDEDIAIVSANYEPEKYPPESGVKEVHFVITSGTVMNTKVFEEVGDFIDDMFIDAVDYEYCYRCISDGYRILRDNKALFTHKLGNPTYVNGIECRNYPAFRYYFITRNNLIVSKMYRKVLPESMRLRIHIKKYKKSARYEADKFRKQLYMVIAKIDYLLWLITGRYYCHIKIK